MLVYLSVLFKITQKNDLPKSWLWNKWPNCFTPTSGRYCWWFRNPARKPPRMVYKTLKNHGTNYQPQLVIAGFLNHQPVCKNFPHFIPPKKRKNLSVRTKKKHAPPGRCFGLAMSRHGVRHPSPTALANQGSALTRPAEIQRFSRTPTFRSKNPGKGYLEVRSDT